MSDDVRKKKYETFARFADAGLSFTEQNGRYPAQAAGEKMIFADIQAKLRLHSGDLLLDAGCGLGNTLIPACFVVAEATGIDHPSVIDSLAKTFTKDNCTLHGGEFLSFEAPRKFSKILIYNVLSALPDSETAFAFIDKGLSLLEPSGLMLVGDVPNTDKKKRFLASRRGGAFSRQWEDRMAAMPPAEMTYKESYKLPAFLADDAFVMDVCRRVRAKGFDASVLAQPQALPFGNTREDILIAGPEYDDGSLSLAGRSHMA